MIFRAYSFVVFVLLSSNFSFSQLTIKEADFNSKTILSKIFHGEFQDENKVQKWPVSSVQALELNGYVDGDNFSYTLVDTIFNLNVDTTNYKIVVFETFEVDSSGRIQDYMFSKIQIGIAYFEKRESNLYLIKFNNNLSNTTLGSRPKSRIEEIGTLKYVLVLKEEIVQDWGIETWFELFYDSRIFLSFTHTTIDYSEKSIFNENPTNYITNKIEIIKTESEYYDLILHSTIVPVNEIESKQSKKTRIIKTKIKFNNEEGSNFLKIPNGYSIQPK